MIERFGATLRGLDETTSADILLRQEDMPTDYTSCTDALERISQVDPDYIVTLPLQRMPSNPDVFNRVSPTVAKHLADDPRFLLAPPGSGADLLIYQRRAP